MNDEARSRALRIKEFHAAIKSADDSSGAGVDHARRGFLAGAFLIGGAGAAAAGDKVPARDRPEINPYYTVRHDWT